MERRVAGNAASHMPDETRGWRSRAKRPVRDKDEISRWLLEQRIDEVECAVPDIAGVARGKVMPAEKFAEWKPAHLPVSIFFQTITGGWVDFGGSEADSEGDLNLIPDLGTVREAPWATTPTVHVIHDVEWKDGGACGYAPRSVLRRVVAAFEEKGWRPMVAPEIEFYLTRPNPDPDYPLEPPVGRSGRQGAARQSYSLSAVDEYDKIVDTIYASSEALGLEIETIIQESGAAQLEINLNHGDPVELADHVFLFKRVIREAAFRHGSYATFMAKPMEREPGSAMHIHQSVVDLKTGRNLFNDENDQPTPLFFGFIGGQQHYLAPATCIFAPYVNSYRRLVPNDAAPINLDWGYDNRSTGLRIPVSPASARRVENRVVGADANPYLALAASLACGLLGMTREIVPSTPITGSAYEHDYALPRGLLEAVSLFEDCTELHQLLGVEFSTLYRELKINEFEEFMRVISPWEREHLLLNV